MSKLEKILREEAEAEIKEILAEADSRAQEIISEAEGRAAARLAAHRKRIEAEARAASHQAQSAAELSIATARVQTKGEVMEQVRQKALRALEQTAADPGYDKVLQVLAEEAMQAVAGTEAVVASPEDRERLSDWASQRQLKLQTDPKLRLGVRIVGRSGRIVENTLPERLHRAWDTLTADITKLLWE
jgi:V/A-type H+-transporting ATPase subunit E